MTQDSKQRDAVALALQDDPKPRSLAQIIDDEYIGGTRGEWYFHVEIGNNTEQGGYCFYKSDIRRLASNAIMKHFGDKSVALEFFRMRHGR